MKPALTAIRALAASGTLFALLGCFAIAPGSVADLPSAEEENAGTAKHRTFQQTAPEEGLSPTIETKGDKAREETAREAKAGDASAQEAQPAPEAPDSAAAAAEAQASVPPEAAGEEAAARPAPEPVPAPATDRHDTVLVSLQDPKASLDLETPAGTIFSDTALSDWRSLSATAMTMRASVCGNEICVKSERGTKKLPAVAAIRAPKGSFVSVAGKKHRGEIWLRTEGKNIRPVARLDLEEYLGGVVPLEIGKLDRSGVEALKAQAVAARTYTVRRMKAGAKNGFHLHSDTRDQVYGGMSAEDDLVNEAIAATAGLIVAWNGEPIEAYYHSTCGGRTADASEVWGKQPVPYLVSVPDLAPDGTPWCAASRWCSWERTWTWDELDGLVSKNMAAAKAEPPAPMKRLDRIQILDNFADGRVRTLEAVGDGSKRALVKGDKTRWLLSDPKQNGSILPSAKFRLEPWGQEGVKAVGSGFGHGIGLCQMGARGRAKAGQNFRQILEAYYPGAKVEPIGR